MAPSKPHTHVVYEPSQWDTLTDDQRDELKRWLCINGIHPDEVPIDEPITIEPVQILDRLADPPWDIHYTVLLRNEKEQRTIPLVDMPPTWALAPEITQAPDGSWAWRCNGAPGCEGWVGLELFSEAGARREYQRHADREHGWRTAR